MEKPTIHLNGSDPQTLLDGYLDTVDAIGVAINALQKCYPNGRDYYPQGDSAIREALQEQNARFTALDKVRNELFEIAESIHVQIEARKR
jgi:hypothetical protein